MKITIRVIARSSQNQIILQPDGSYKVKVTTAPVDGAANKKVIELVSKEWKVPKSGVRIVRGETSRNKIVEIDIPNT